MPIRPSQRAKYPKNWPEISARIRERAKNRCEKCLVPNGVVVARGNGFYMLETGETYDEDTGEFRHMTRGSEMGEVLGRDRRFVRIVLTVSPVSKDEKGDEKRVTLSGLLNVLDGVFARDGRILIMTTNHPEKVDPALLRPGRADRRETIGELGAVEVLEMCQRFLPSHEAQLFAKGTEAPIAPAALQERLLRTRGELPSEVSE